MVTETSRTRWEEQTFFISGGGSGIGRALTLALAGFGANVFITGRRIEKLEETIRLAQDLPGKIAHGAADLRIPAEVDTVVKEALRVFGRIDGLVNNAGGQFPSLLEDLSPNGWNAVITNNLNAPFYLAREVFRQWMREHGGTILNVAAECRNGMPQMGHSGAARAGMINFTMTAAVEWAKYGIRINALAPGLIETSGLDTYPDKFRARLESLKERIPLRRFGTLDEVIQPMLFLLSSGSTFVTGMIFEVDGGQRLTGPM